MSRPDVTCNALSTQDATRPLCEGCDKPYTRKRSWQTFCSPECRVRTWTELNPRVRVGVRLGFKPTAEQLESAGFKVRKSR